MGSSTAQVLVGLDVGGTKIEAIAVAPDERILSHVHLPMNAGSGELAVESICQAVRVALEQADLSPVQVRAVGLGIPGQVDDGVVRLAVNLKLSHYPLGEKLSQAFGIPFLLENDVRIAALGVHERLRRASGSAPHSLVYLSIGTGIAAGLMIDGQIYRGVNGLAGEVGHVIVEPHGAQCRCGLRGCLETIASGPALAAQVQAALQAGEPSSLSGADPLNARAVFAAAAAGDVLARRVLQRASAFLARAIQWLVMSYDVDRVVLGGGVSHEGAAFLEPILDELAALRAQSPLADLLLKDEKIILLPGDFNPGLWGAITLAGRFKPK